MYCMHVVLNAHQLKWGDQEIGFLSHVQRKIWGYSQLNTHLKATSVCHQHILSGRYIKIILSECLVSYYNGGVVKRCMSDWENMSNKIHGHSVHVSTFDSASCMHGTLWSSGSCILSGMHHWTLNTDTINNTDTISIRSWKQSNCYNKLYNYTF